MNSIVVVSVALTQEQAAYECLVVTAGRVGMPLVMLTGENSNLASNDNRLFHIGVEKTLAYLNASDVEYVVLTDAFDVLVAHWSPEVVIRQIENSPGKLLISAEANCFPDGPWREAYDLASRLRFQHTGVLSPWHYANMGQLCGRRKEIIRLLEALQSNIFLAVSGGAQELVHKMYSAGEPIALDYKCTVFQSMYTEWVKSVIWDEGYRVAVNEVTRAWPMFLHFNGRAPGMPEWYKRLTSKPYPRNSKRPEYA